MHRRTRVLVARRCCQLALSKPEQLRCLASSTRSGSLVAQLIGAWQSEKIRRYWAVFDCFLRCRRSRRRARRAARHRGQVGRGGTLQLPSSPTLKSIEEAMTILGLIWTIPYSSAPRELAVDRHDSCDLWPRERNETS